MTLPSLKTLQWLNISFRKKILTKTYKVLYDSALACPSASSFITPHYQHPLYRHSHPMLPSFWTTCSILLIILTHHSTVSLNAISPMKLSWQLSASCDIGSFPSALLFTCITSYITQFMCLVFFFSRLWTPQRYRILNELMDSLFPTS